MEVRWAAYGCTRMEVRQAAKGSVPSMEVRWTAYCNAPSMEVRHTAYGGVLVWR